MQSGGSFDVDYSVIGPGGKVVLDGSKERQGDYVFTAQSVGEYRFCFNNEMSTFAEKLVDFEIAVCVLIYFYLSSDAAGCRRAHARALAQNLFCIVSDFMGPRRAELMPPVGQCWLTIHRLLVSLFRSRTKNARSCPRDRARVPSRRRLSKSRFSNCLHSCRPSHGTKNTSGRARTAISVPFGARRDGSSTLV